MRTEPSVTRHRLAVALGLCVAAPVLGYVGLLYGIEKAGGTTLMLGAVSDLTETVLFATGLELALRLYLVVLLPSLATYLLVFQVSRRARFGKTS